MERPKCIKLSGKRSFVHQGVSSVCLRVPRVLCSKIQESWENIQFSKAALLKMSRELKTSFRRWV